jgi:predicted ATPase
MWLTTIQLKNVKSFVDSGEVKFSKGINVLVGPNNAGKSIILRSAYLLQGQENDGNAAATFLQRSARLKSESSEIRLGLSDPKGSQLRCIPPNFNTSGWKPEFVFLRKAGQFQVTMRKNNPPDDFLSCTLPICCQREPDNFIYPYFSRRKPPGFDPGINRSNETVIEEVFAHLPAKIDRLAYPRRPGYKDFEETCQNCLQFPISTATHPQGKEVGLVLPDGSLVSVETMGEGTPSVLSLLAHLCIARGHLFLIEEPENDIHPKALKALLDFIICKSSENQFLVSTHNNIVLKMLGGAPDAHVFSLEMCLDPRDQIPTSTCRLLDDAPEPRLRLLQELGYEPSDLYFYDAYLILEESSAERIIRDFLIPHMFPKLQGRLRTIAAGGISKVEPCFDDFHRLFVYLHTAPQYRNRAWVAVDAGPEGEVVVSRLKEKFSVWDQNRFKCFAASNFEKYYPPTFQDKVERVLALRNNLACTKEKGRLAEDVVAWCFEHPDDATQWFKQSAKDVVALLDEIQHALAAPLSGTQLP